MLNRFALVCGFCALACIAFGANPSDFALKMEKKADDTVLLVGSWTVNEVQGWSFGVCHNSADASIGTCAGGSYGSCADANTKCPSITCSQQVLTSNAGAAPSFVTTNVFTGGLTQGVVIDFMQVNSLAASTRFELLTIKYTLIAANPVLTFCSTLGSPPTDTVFVLGGASIAPAVKDGITLGGAVQTCDMKMNLAKSGTDKVAVSIDTAKNEADPALGATGFSFGIADDSAAISVSSIAAGAAAKALMGGGDPEFWSVKVVPEGATLGCVFSIQATVKALPACTANQEVAVVSYQNGGASQATANVTLSGNLGSPKVAVIVDVDGVPFEPIIGAGVSITLGGGAPPFKRGDVNQDGKLNVSDGVAIARYVFGLGSQKAKIDACKDSADANDDGAITTADALYVLNYLFTGGPVVKDPFTACGQDTTADALDCVTYPCQ